MSDFILERASLGELRRKMANGNSICKLEFTAAFDVRLAEKMGVRWTFFDSDDMIRPGLKKHELEFEIRNMKLRFEPAKLGHVLELNSEIADKFVIERKGDGKKKPKRLVLKFKLTHAGSVLPLAEFQERVGDAVGVLVLTPLQSQLPLEEQPKKKKKKVERDEAEAAAAEAQRFVALLAIRPHPDEDDAVPDDDSEPPLTGEAKSEHERLMAKSGWKIQ